MTTPAPATGTGALHATGVEKRFGGVHALNGVGIDVHERTICGLIGPNGAGKSTLLKVLSGFLTPDSGRVTLGDTSLTSLSAAQVARAGLVATFQHATPIAGLTVVENVLVGMTEAHRGGVLSALFGLRAARASEREQREQARELVCLFGLERVADVDAGSLSFGQLRMLELVRAAAAGPRMLLLDEPAAGLNKVETDRMSVLIRQLRDEREISFLVVDHDVAFVFGICSEITVMNFGEIIAVGTPAEVEANPKVHAAYLSVS